MAQYVVPLEVRKKTADVEVKRGRRPRKKLSNQKRERKSSR